MFCPKCGTQNPETGKFCRSCGTDLGNVSQALTGQLQPARPMVDRKGKPVSLGSRDRQDVYGTCLYSRSVCPRNKRRRARLVVLAPDPGFTSLGAGVAQLVQLRKAEPRTAGLQSDGFGPRIGRR